MKDGPEVFEEIERTPAMEKLLSAYQKNFSYAVEISWHEVMNSVRVLYALTESE